jgi:SAM-dependent methyltransferase
MRGLHLEALPRSQSRIGSFGHTVTLERAISDKFKEIADIGWFSEDLSPDSTQLQLVREVLRPAEGKRILDAGCARGRFAKNLVRSGAAVFGIDLTEVFVRDARRNVPPAAFACASLSALPFDRDLFDGVYCVEVMQHVPVTESALRELSRILKPGGTLLVIDRSLQALDAHTGLPTMFVKSRAERQGRVRLLPSGQWKGWMYPRDFPFRERWFWPARLARLMRQSFRSVEVRYLTLGYGRKAGSFYRLFPFLAPEAAWIARK